MGGSGGVVAARRPSLTAQYIVAIIIYAVAYFYAIKFAVAIKDTRTGWKGVVNTFHEGCVLRAGGTAGEILTGGRGDQYFIGAMTPEKAKDLETNVMSFWGFTHGLAYFFLGIYCPDLFWQTFAAGCAFELYERQRYQCQDLLDIVWNTVGFAVGRWAGDWARAGRAYGCS